MMRALKVWIRRLSKPDVRQPKVPSTLTTPLSPHKKLKARDIVLAFKPVRMRVGFPEAVANSGIALTESARLLEIPRKCSNGNAAPIQGTTWKKGLTQLRSAGRAAYDAKYREKTPRCVD
jgi:hypothetical protein